MAPADQTGGSGSGSARGTYTKCSGFGAAYYLTEPCSVLLCDCSLVFVQVPKNKL